MLQTNFIVLVSSGFRVAHIQQRENEIKLIGDESAELSLDILCLDSFSRPSGPNK
jgi:hypothetical protein